MGSLVAFEAAARLGSFAAAASELGVSQAAISQQVRALESYLQCALFERSRQRVQATATGLELGRQLTRRLGSIADTLERLRRPSAAASTVVLSASSAFCHYWLAPRLRRLRQALPGISLRLVARDPYVDLESEEVDIAIRYGGGHWRRLTAMPFFEEAVVPVCSRTYLAGTGLPRRPADYRRHTLLHYDSLNANWLSWNDWFAAAGLPPARIETTLSFSSYQDVLEAALAGVGIAIGWRRIVGRLLADGKLIALSDQPLRPRDRYWLVTPRWREASRAAQKLREWLRAEAVAEPLWPPT